MPDYPGTCPLAVYDNLDDKHPLTSRNEASFVDVTNLGEVRNAANHKQSDVKLMHRELGHKINDEAYMDLDVSNALVLAYELANVLERVLALE